MPYTDDELQLLASVPQMIGTAVTTASGSGIFGTGKELFAIANSLGEGVKLYPNNALIRQITPGAGNDRTHAMEWMSKSRDWITARLKAKGVDSVEKLRALLTEDLRAAASVLASNATPQEAREYKQWALTVAEKVANASSEGGFLGFGGERVTAAEKALIDKVKSALGITDEIIEDGTPHPSFGSARKTQSAGAGIVEKGPAPDRRALAGRKIMITAGSTHEPIDMTHYMAKHSTGEQGYALAEAAVALGAETVLVSGPTSLPLPPGAQVMMANTALEMLKICERELPCDIAVFAAEVTEWSLDQQSGGERSAEQADDKLNLKLVKNPDILRSIATLADKRPTVVVGFTAESENAIENARKKLDTEGCDLIVAYDGGSSNVVQQRQEHGPCCFDK